MLVSKWLQWPISEMAVESINQLRLFPAVAVSLFALNNCTLNAKCLRRHITTYRMRLHINLKYFRVTCAAVITVGIWQFQLCDPKNLSLDIPVSQLLGVGGVFLGNDFATFTAARVKNSHMQCNYTQSLPASRFPVSKRHGNASQCV
jgi:hypothetical protein